MRDSKINIQHPFYPRTLVLPNYVENKKEILELLGLFFGLVAFVLVVTWIIATKRGCRVLDRLVICWFVVCGFIHMILEGYFALFHKTLVGESTYLAEMWKEYSKGDSRYITSDTFVVCMESITALVDGPLCFGTAVAHMYRSRHRFVLQLIVSLCQLYGDTLYMLTEVKENFSHGEFGHPLHFWFYFVFLNLFWIFVPLTLIVQSSLHLCQAQDHLDVDNRKINGGKKFK